MFSKSNKKNDMSSDGKSARPAPPSIISTDLKITGDLHCEGEIQIDGNIEGDIRTNSLLIGKTAIIKGEIVADSVRVHGTVNGQIKARTVILATTAHVVGDILHEDLAIENGAFLEGHCKRIPSQTEAVQQQRKVEILKSTGSNDQATKPVQPVNVAG